MSDAEDGFSSAQEHLHTITRVDIGEGFLHFVYP